MSGCHIPNCLSVCCADIKSALGDLSMKINKLESSLREFEKQRVNPKFEEVRKFEIEHEKKISDLEESYRGLFHDYNHLEDAIVELRKPKDCHLAFDLKELEKKFNILLLNQHNLKSLLGSLHEEVESKHPYECPVCSGRGWKVVALNGDQCRDHCHSCSETGIVWG